jgi:3-carboxy-cis,cis-muconate cycloisomerase
LTSNILIGSLATTEEMAELFFDNFVLAAMLAFEIGLSRAQARIGMIPTSAADAIARVVVEDFDPAAIAREGPDSASIAIPFVKALTSRVQSIDAASAGFVHWGATSQDLIDTALILLLLHARVAMERHHENIAARLRVLSERHATTVMLSRTLLQPAPPTTFGYKAAAWFGALDRSWRRLHRAFIEASQLQFGGASGTLAAYGNRGPALAEELSKELSLALPDGPWHTHRDRLADLVANCGIYAGSLGKIARDVALLMQHEIGEVSERGGESSAMPNKRNPSASVLILAAATRIPGMVASYLSAMVQEQERAAGAWQAEWPIVAGVIQTTGSAMETLADMLDGLTVNADRMRFNIARTRGSVFAEKAAMLLAPKLGRTAAQALVAEAAKGQSLRDGLAKDARIAALLSPHEIETIDSPVDYLGAAEFFRQRLLEQKD